MTEQAQEQQVLWTDEAIKDELRECALIARGMDVYTSLDVAERVCISIRDDLTIAIAERDEARRKITYYEDPLPTMEDNKYTVTTDHRFTDEGICIRCGEDAEEWDAGCVESFVNDVLRLEAEWQRVNTQLTQAQSRIAELEATGVLGNRIHELEVENKALRAKLEAAGEWQPMQSGTLTSDTATISVGDGQFDVIADVGDDMMVLTWEFPDSVRLCKRNPAAQEDSSDGK